MKSKDVEPDIDVEDLISLPRTLFLHFNHEDVNSKGKNNFPAYLPPPLREENVSDIVNRQKTINKLHTIIYVLLI